MGLTISPKPPTSTLSTPFQTTAFTRRAQPSPPRRSVHPAPLPPSPAHRSTMDEEDDYEYEDEEEYEYEEDGGGGYGSGAAAGSGGTPIRAGESKVK